jgi:hypothetical protein
MGYKYAITVLSRDTHSQQGTLTGLEQDALLVYSGSDLVLRIGILGTDQLWLQKVLRRPVARLLLEDLSNNEQHQE